MGHPIYEPLDPSDPHEVGGYRLVARLGAGGMGRVFLGMTRSGRRLAVKVVRPEFADDPDFRRRFEQEVANAQRVQNLYTAPVIDADPVGPRPWLATAHVPGPSLAQAVMEEGPLPVASVRALAAGVAEALQAIHKAGVIHRDLKPSNVILAADGPRVIDFGIARAADATPLTRTGGLVGSPQFMAPEQVRGLPSTPALDVFAFGLLVFFAATGRSPFNDGPPQAVMYRIANEEPVYDGCSPELVGLISRCLEKDPEDRPAVNDLLNELTDAPHTGWLPAAMATRLEEYETLPAVDFGPPQPPTGHLATTPPPTAPSYAPGTAPEQQTPAPGQYPPTFVQPPTPLPPTGHHTPPPGFPGAPAPQPPKRRLGPILAAATAGVLLVAGASVAALKLTADDEEGKGKDSPSLTAPQTSQPQQPVPSTAASAPQETPLSSETPAPGATGPSQAAGEPEVIVPGTKPPGTVLGEYKGIKLARHYDLNLTEDPTHPREDDGDVEYSGFYVSAPQIAVVPPGQSGTYETCRDNTAYTTSLNDDYLRKGLVFCVTSPKGVIALITITGRESAPSDHLTLNLVVWQGSFSTQN